jgi:hypothetical protein
MIPMIPSSHATGWLAWKALLQLYHEDVSQIIDGIIIYRYRLGFEGTPTRIISKHLETALLDENKMTDILVKVLILQRVARSDDYFSFPCSLL